MSSFLSSDASITIESFPYRHLLIENFLSDAFANSIEASFCSTIEKAAPIGKVGEVGDLQYSAINYTPDLMDLTSTPIGAFATDEMRAFICGLLGARSNDCFMLGSHRHEPPSRDGWPHSDLAVVCFPENGPRLNGMEIFQPDSGCVYADDTLNRQPNARKVARSVACLYYLGNHDWQPGDGGETAVYGKDRKSILKRVPPIHNSLFAFEISPFSYHGYLASLQKMRDSYIWWYHDEVESVMDRHQSLFNEKRSAGVDAWDRWTGSDESKYDQSLEEQRR